MRLKELRIELGMTQKQVADFLNISQMSYSYYEREMREPEISTLIKLSKLFNTTVDYIIENENERLDRITDSERSLLNKFKALNQINRTKVEERIDVLYELQKGTDNSENNNPSN